VAPWQTFQERFATAFVGETRAFVSFALGRAATFDGATGVAAARALEVAEACEQSHAREQIVRLADRTTADAR
jgi:predicted dehydrogenase